MHRRNDGPSRSVGAGRDALPRVRRCTSRHFFLLLLPTRSCAIGAEALSHQLNEVFAFLGRAMSDRAGARPYQLNVRRRIARERIPAPAEPIGELTPITREAAVAYFDQMIANIRNPQGYAVWMVPVVSAQVV
jgi:hypothetical protein